MTIVRVFGPIPKKKPRRPASGRNGTAAGTWHMANVKGVGCVVCGSYAEAHHPLTMRQGSRASDFDTIALCFNHHSKQSPLPFGQAIHNGTESFCRQYGSEATLLEQTRLKLRLAGLPDGSDLSVLLAYRARHGRQPIPLGLG